MRAKAEIDDVVRLRTNRRDPREERESLPPEEPRRKSGRPDPREEPEWDEAPRVRGSSSLPPAGPAQGVEGDELDATDRAPVSSTPRPVSPPAASAGPSERPLPTSALVTSSVAPKAPSPSVAPSALSPSVAPKAPTPSVSPPATGSGDALDPRLIELEPLLSRGDWAAIVERLGPPERAGELPPTLGLVFALAQREAHGDRSATPANVLAIKCMAAIYGVAPESATALVLAKRLLRQNPASWRTAPAPSARVAIPLIVLAIAVGAVAGGFLSLGTFRFF